MRDHSLYLSDILLVFAKQMKKIIEETGFTGKTTPKQV